jgi:hypothetical protein
LYRLYRPSLRHQPSWPRLATLVVLKRSPTGPNQDDFSVLEDGVVVSQPHLPVARAWQIFPSSCDLSHRQAARKCARRSPTSRSRERTGNAHALLHRYRRRSRHWPHLVGCRDYQACPGGQRGPAGAETAAHHRRGAGQERFGLLNCCVSCARTLEMVARGCQAAFAKLTASSFLSAAGL